jgi:acyl CoA:acetate/3-ketoacid CoA transferase beta subunit
MSINLGIGIPTYLPADIDIMLQSEDGILGVDDYPRLGQQDPDLINAGKLTNS